MTCEQAIIFVYRVFLGDYQVRKTPFAFIDGHADTPTAALNSGQGLYENNLQIDFKRLCEYAAPVQVFSIWVSEKHLDNAFEYADTVLDFIRKELARHSDIVGLALSPDDLLKNAAENKISAILALEGGEPLEGDIENLDYFYDRGIRLITLTWSRENELGYGVAAESEDGLKPFGIECVKKMDEKGIIIDVSHLNETGFWDVDKLASRPYAASHSNARSVTPHMRNLNDKQIGAIVAKGGFIGLNLYPDFLSESGSADIGDVMNHIRRFAELGAIDNIGLGCDYDGISKTPDGLSDVSSLKDLAKGITAEFGARTSSKIMAGNFYDFFMRFYD
jgi:membrane dipeptidase